MPIYRSYVPNAYSLSPQMLGGGLDLAGGGFSIAKGAKIADAMRARDDSDDELEGEGFGKGTQRKLKKYGQQGAHVAEALIGQFGTDDQKDKARTARKVADTIAGAGLDGEGFGRGTQKKIMKYGKQGAHVAEALVGQFGTDQQKQKVATARKVADTISGSGSGMDSTSALPASHLRAMAKQGVAHF